MAPKAFSVSSPMPETASEGTLRKGEREGEKEEREEKRVRL